MQGTRVSFKSKEDAVHFAEKQGMYIPVVSTPNANAFGVGWDYYVCVMIFLRSLTLFNPSSANLLLQRESLPRIMARTTSTNPASFAFVRPSNRPTCNASVFCQLSS